MREAKALEANKSQAGPQALLVFGDALLVAHRRQVTAFATQHHLPPNYVLRDFVEAGGLMSYGPERDVPARRGVRG